LPTGRRRPVNPRIREGSSRFLCRNCSFPTEEFAELTNRSARPDSRTAWAAHPEPGWEAVAEVCRSVFAELPGVAEHIINAIVRDVPEYRPEVSPFTPEDLLRSVSRTIAEFLQGVAENRVPSEEELAFRRHIGRRSAILGFPIQPSVASYQVGYRELWALLVERAMQAGDPAPMLLLRAGSTVMQRLQAVTAAVVEGHQEELARREAQEMRTAGAFLEAVIEDPTSDQTHSFARQLRLDPDGRFRAIALGETNVSLDPVRTIIADLQASGVVFTGIYGRVLLIVCQGVDVYRIDAALAGSPAGIGREGYGLEGCRVSLSEAQLALDLATVRDQPCRFDQRWLSALALRHRNSIEPMLVAGVLLAGRKPHLADAVRSFARSRFSVTDGARNLHVSPSTFRYRLMRWKQLTGWDPWTHEGLTRSLIAFEFDLTGTSSARRA
jgi:PucR-like helix-turn-helix protein